MASILRKKLSFKRVLLIAFGLAFGLGLIAMVYEGVKSSSDLRSRAGQTAVALADWEFNGKTTEGWGTANVAVGLGAQNGYLTFRALSKLRTPAPQTVTLTNSNAFAMRNGVKTVELVANVGSLTASGRANQPTTSFPYSAVVEFTGRPRGQSITTSQVIPELTVTFQGTADGQFHTYTQEIPNSLNTYDITGTSLKFMGLQGAVGVSVSVDRLRVLLALQTMTKPTTAPRGGGIAPTVAPGCHTTVQVMGVNRPANCPSGYATQASYSCSDSYQGSLGDGATCTLVKSFEDQANVLCAARPAPCGNTGPSPKPSSSAPTPTPVCATLCNSQGKCVRTCTGSSNYTPTPPTPTPSKPYFIPYQ